MSPTDNTGNNGATGDPDGDGLTNLQEYQAGANPQNPDTDNDGMSDAWEVQNSLGPNNPTDADADRYTNFEEFWMGTNPQTNATPVTIYVDAAYTGYRDRQRNSTVQTHSARY